MRIESSLSIDRTGLSLPPLVINNNPFDGAYTYPEEGLSEPNFSMRVAYAPDSAWVPGRLALGAVLDAATIPLVLAVKGTSQANLTALKNELAVAVGQLSYAVTMTVAGIEVGTWPAFATQPWWGVVDHGDAQALLCVGQVQIPVNPPA